MKVKSMKYFPLKAIKAQNIFEFLSMEDLTQFAEFHQLKEIFILQNSEATSDHFAVMHHNNLLQHATEGFATVDDYLVAKNKSFPDANSYYEAIKSGYDSYENYYMVKEAGIKDKEEFDKIQQGGFIAGFKNDWQDQPDTTSLPQQINNAFELYQYAINRGFDTFSNFWDALQKGFENRDIYDIAREYGFDNAADYEEAKAKGFQLYEHLQLARNLKARDQEDLIRMNNIVSVNCTDCGMDERLMLVLLSKIEQGKRVSINKLMDLLEKSINEYRYADTGEMPEWFKRVFDGRESIISFLQINIEVKKFGTYDNDGEFFEINHMKDRKVVIDGSNVAHCSRGNAKSKPKLENLILLISFLQSKGFTEISIIADASLRHKIVDTEKMEAVKDLADYQESPSGTSADKFILDRVKNTHCLLVSNDTFREWKIADPWIAENIDYYRLSFMINQDEVLMPDLK